MPERDGGSRFPIVASSALILLGSFLLLRFAVEPPIPSSVLGMYMFFIAVALVSLGSGYYHWAPSNDSLLWDRLPMSIAFMALSSAIVADRINADAGNGWLLGVLLFLGVASLVYWDWTESLGRGDLRFYGFVQFYPMLALPIICWLFRECRYTPVRYIVWLIAWYGLSKVLEFFDAAVFELTGNLVSGHSLKHLAAAVATFMVLRMLLSREEARSAMVPAA